MPLTDIEFDINAESLPADVEAFLNEADARVEEFAVRHHVGNSGFVPSDYVTVYRALRAIVEAGLAPGESFCEWGSGFGVVASLAAMLGLHSHGIEIESELIEASRLLAEDYDLPVEFIHGSFVPHGGGQLVDDAYADTNEQLTWLVTDSDDAYDELGLDPCDFDLIFAYPWPGEECVIEALFERYAATGALLLTYNQYDSVHVQRKRRSK